MTERERILEMLDILAAWFHVAAPRLKVTRRKGGCYYSDQRMITMNPGVPDGRYGLTDESIIVHEFAHHLNEATAQYRAMPNHAGPFARALMDVVGAWYSNPDDYPWKTEYKGIISRCRGTTKP